MTLDDVSVDRNEKLARADCYFNEARKMAVFIAQHTGVPQHCFELFTLCMVDAARHYRAAGLGLLAGRVAYFAYRNDVLSALDKFDRLNAGGCGVT
jgi:hypothetical protein